MADEVTDVPREVREEADGLCCDHVHGLVREAHRNAIARALLRARQEGYKAGYSAGYEDGVRLAEPDDEECGDG